MYDFFYRLTKKRDRLDSTRLSVFQCTNAVGIKDTPVKAEQQPDALCHIRRRRFLSVHDARDVGTINCQNGSSLIPAKPRYCRDNNYLNLLLKRGKARVPFLVLIIAYLLIKFEYHND